MTQPSTRALACAASLFASVPFGARAQDVSRVVAATLYYDSAVVERQLKTPGGTRHLQVDCMPPGFKPATLQIDGEPSVHLGDVRTEPVTGADALACARGPLDARIRALEDQKAELQAQSRADDLTVDYLKRWNGGAATAPAAVAAHAQAADRTMPAADTLRKSALDLMNDQLRLTHQLADLDRQLAGVQKAAHAVKSNGSWTTLRFDVSTAAAGVLRLRYQMPDANWHIGYRAALDTATSTLHLDQQAEITQASGEDWSDVALTLAMSAVSRRSSPASPESWDLQVHRPQSDSSAIAGNRQRVEVTGSRISRFQILPQAIDVPAPALDRSPVVSMGAEERDWGTLFHASQPVSLLSDGQTHTLVLDSRTLPVQLHLQAVPLNDLAAYLLAEAPTPAGIWPWGKLQKWRDGTLIETQEDWSPSDDDHLAVYFGRDDRVRITVRRPASMTASTGFFGSQTQRSWGSIFVVTNAHDTPQTLELIDMAPVSHDESVKVVSKYDPAPTTTDWEHKPGVNAWSLKLAPNQTRQVSVSQQVTYPKDTTIGNMPDAP